MLLCGHQLVCLIALARPQLPPNYQEEAWSKLREAVDAIHQKRSVSSSLEELYQVSITTSHDEIPDGSTLCIELFRNFQTVSNLCMHNMAAQLYDNLKKVCEAYVLSCLNQFVVETVDTEQFLKLMNQCWAGHCEQMVGYNISFIV